MEPHPTLKNLVNNVVKLTAVIEAFTLADSYFNLIIPIAELRGAILTDNVEEITKEYAQLYIALQPMLTSATCSLCGMQEIIKFSKAIQSELKTIMNQQEYNSVKQTILDTLETLGGWKSS